MTLFFHVLFFSDILEDNQQLWRTSFLAHFFWFLCYDVDTMAAPLTTDQLLETGLVSKGLAPGRIATTSNTTLISRFRSLYYLNPDGLDALVNELQTTNVADARIERVSVPKLLVALNWLKRYKSEKEQAVENNMDEKTIRTSNWKYVSAIAALKNSKVRKSWMTQRFSF